MKAIRASAVESVLSFVDQIGQASAAVLTGIVLAANQLHGAILPAVLGLAEAVIVGLAVGTGAMGTRQEPLALVNLQFAMFTLVSLVALAGVAAHTIDASAGPARTALALVDVDLAILAGDTLNAQALVATGSRVVELLREDCR